MLSRVDYSNDRLVAIFGHELRSHLAPIKNAAELLQRSTIDPATTLRIAGIIERQVDGMTRLVDELLGSMQTKAFALRLRPADTAVQEIIERSIEMIAPLMLERRHVLSVQMPDATLGGRARRWLARRQSRRRSPQRLDSCNERRPRARQHLRTSPPLPP